MEPKSLREHERRFLVADSSVLDGLSGTHIHQGYLFSTSTGWKGRVRRELAVGESGGDRDLLPQFTLKGPKVATTSTEYTIYLQFADAEELLAAAEPVTIEKVRIPIVSEGNAWEVDRFLGRNWGLIIAEFEGSLEAVAGVRKPWWCGAEVTSDRRYFNENLAATPWSTWPREKDESG